jgi:uncharacterized protein (DUF433 family)
MAIADTLVATPPPVRLDESGTLRVGQTRVTLDTVVGAWKDGATAEQIVLDYDSLNLAEVHATISYYLKHQEEVEAYLRERETLAEEVRRQIEARSSMVQIRERILARHAKQS